MKYKLKSIEAMQLTEDAPTEIAKFLGDKFKVSRANGGKTTDVDVATKAGTMVALKGDYVIKGVDGEYSLMKPEVFEALYELDSDVKAIK